ncbi:TetR/AcrR family transcriptional regulator [Haladaptatus sp. AB643]|uniref:TetR/AcrR family transcriptional regulator n=1 Tax=Haladaptatus sp. AB643 TaxID=2934174 RepID=UPI00209BDA69|nr:TetR/AcrR family transcriptional regulator [Haladaptatus sp. AB643]MCO8246329.1 TetR/AcrR family transcriptional regulator [Haladaptatus sp. AB643]
MHNFSDEEREEIRENLVETARELIIRHGFKKTTVEDITEPVGIGESTFYQFFDSKSKIFLTVIVREHESLIDTIESEFTETDDPEADLERLIHTWADEFENRPILRAGHQTFSEYPFQSVEAEMHNEMTNKYLEQLGPIIEGLKGRSDGLIQELDPSVVMEVLSVIELMSRYRDEYEKYGSDEYSFVRDTLITTVARGLTREKQR